MSCGFGFTFRLDMDMDFVNHFNSSLKCWKIAPILKKINLLVVVELHKKCK